MAVSISTNGAQKVRDIMSKQGKADHGLRVGVRGGGCSGLSYAMDLVAAAEPQDMVFECEGVRIYVDPKSYLYLDGTQLDYVDDLNGGGWKFVNPNVRKECGCGESFSV